MRYRHLFLVISLAWMTVGCGSKLSRSHAQELLQSKLGLPLPQTTDILHSYNKRIVRQPTQGFAPICLEVDLGNTPHFSDVERKLSDWQSGGLVTVSEATVHNQCNDSYINANVELTEAGRKYLQSDSDGTYHVRVYDLAFGEVTGMQVNEQLKVAQVDYTLTRANFTPFATDASDKSAPQTSRSAVFALYDDGWRVSETQR